jgi:hypothetical protein
MDWLLRLLGSLGARIVTILVVLGAAALVWLFFLSSQ